MMLKRSIYADTSIGMHCDHKEASSVCINNEIYSFLLCAGVTRLSLIQLTIAACLHGRICATGKTSYHFWWGLPALRESLMLRIGDRQQRHFLCLLPLVAFAQFESLPRMHNGLSNACSYGVDIKFASFTNLDAQQSRTPSACVQGPLVSIVEAIL